MKYHRAMLIFSIPLVLIFGGVWWYLQQEGGESRTKPLMPSTMQITSTAFQDNKNIPSKYTCDAENINPPLSISEVPEDAKSLALIVDDPDAPSKTWVHWVAWDIDPSESEIKEGSAPTGTEGTTDFGTTGWGGPCPPSGTHRYFFKLYALNAKLNLDPSTTKESLESAMEGHILEESELIGLYKKNI